MWSYTPPTPVCSVLNSAGLRLYLHFFTAWRIIIIFAFVSASSGRTRLPSTQTVSWVLMALRSTSCSGRRLWSLGWESAAALVRWLHETKSSSSWQYWSRSCSLCPCQDRKWTWPQYIVSQWSTQPASWKLSREQGMNSDFIANTPCVNHQVSC